MIKEYQSIIGTQVHHNDDGSILAVVKDVIIDTDKGKIEAVGKHEELLKSSKTYKELYNLQFSV